MVAHTQAATGHAMPSPNAQALAHSHELTLLIHRAICAAGGWIDFERYMELALYAPGLGYYSAGAAKLGPDGDFVTAPEISSLFGRALARQVLQILQLTDGEVLEFGAGSGKLALDLLTELHNLGALPRRYCILEVSADLRERQGTLLAKRLPPSLFAIVEWIDTLPDQFTGAIIANEVLDAIPTQLVAWRADGCYLRGVTVENNNFAFAERPLSPGPLVDVASHIQVPTDYVSEINLRAQAFTRSLAKTLQLGAAILFDYGFPAREFYHPQRHMGTLMCHYRHLAHPDPFYLPGLQDITSHVDFTAIATSASAVGATLGGYTRQANFLIDCGITDLLTEVSPNDSARFLPLANQAQRLLSPNEMGELYKVLAFGKGLPEPLMGFRSSGAVGL